jgi:outer membrane lipoprotein SlyB
MKNKKLLIAGLMLLSTTGCTAGMNNTEQGALGGGAFGAILGALIGGPRHALAGAAIGGATGALAGGAVGASADARDDRRQAQAIAAANAQAQRQMSLTEIVQMAQTGVSDSVIIQQIDATGSIFNLTSADIQYLHEQRVSDTVINVMLSRRTRVIYAAPPPRPVVVYEAPPPPPPVGVGVIIR